MRHTCDSIRQGSWDLHVNYNTHSSRIAKVQCIHASKICMETNSTYSLFVSYITGNTVESISGTEVTTVDCHKYISCISIEGIYFNYHLMSMDKQNELPLFVICCVYQHG